MTLRLGLAAAVLAAAGVSAQSHVVFRDATAESLFRTSRNAIGGEGLVSGIGSFVLKGTATVAENDGGPQTRDVEVRILLPSGILRIDTASGFEKRAGFMEGTLLTSVRVGDSRDAPPAALRSQMIRGERARLGRMMLGMAATPIRPGWLTLRSVRTAVTTVDPRSTIAAEGGAATTLTAERDGQRILEAAADEGFFIRIFFDGATLPGRIQYETGNRAQVVTEFSDRRRVAGLMLPHRIVTTTGGRVVDDFTIREIEVNPRLTAADFER